MGVRVCRILKLCHLFLSLEIQKVLVNEKIPVFLVTELTSESLEDGVVGELESLLKHALLHLVLLSSKSRLTLSTLLELNPEEVAASYVAKQFEVDLCEVCVE